MGTYEGWEQDVRDAREAFHIYSREKQPVYGQERSIVHIEAEADTGSRYTVISTPIGPFLSPQAGGQVLVSVLHPYRTAYVIQYDSFLMWTYVQEKFIPAGRAPVFGGDIAALTLAICHATGGTPGLPD